MNSTVERTLYLVLLLVFIGVGIAVYVAISFGAKLDQELKQSQANQKALAQSVDALKKDNAQQTEYIKCLLTAHNLGQYAVANCAVPNASGKTSEQLQPETHTTNPSITSSHANDSSGNTSSSNPPPGVVQALSSLLRKIGL